MSMTMVVGIKSGLRHHDLAGLGQVVVGDLRRPTAVAVVAGSPEGAPSDGDHLLLEGDIFPEVRGTETGVLIVPPGNHLSTAETLYRISTESDRRSERSRLRL